MLVLLLCAHVVQIDDNESSWRKKKMTTFYCRQAKDMWAWKKSKKTLLKKCNGQETQWAQT
jgi:hypothetical protein